jgi:integrase/recombinase XerD
MITLHLVLDTRRQKANGTYPLIFRINCGGVTRDIPTGFSTLPGYWDSQNRRLLKSHPQFSYLDTKLREQELEYLGKILQLEKAQKGVVDIQILKEQLCGKEVKPTTVKSFWQLEIDTLIKNNRAGNARVNQQALNVLEKVKSLDIPFEKLDYSFLKQLESEMLRRGTRLNSIGVYMRALRAVYNQAINADLVEHTYYPFRKYKIKKEPTIPHPITQVEMQRYFQLQIPESSFMYESWLIGKLIFMLGGINAADLFQLTEKNLKNGRVIYKRSKTKKLYSVKLLPHAVEIFTHFQASRKSTLLGWLTDEELKNKTRLPYILQQKTHLLNNHLKKLGVMIGSKEPLRSYTFRYTIANLCKQMGYDVQLIAELLGHSYGNKVTGIYLEPYDKSLVDEMSEAILNGFII